MALNANNVKHGTAGGVDINVDVTRIDHSVSVRVQLSADYVTLCPPGIPTRPEFTGAPGVRLDYPRTVVSGTTLHLLAGEAAALVAASKASYV